MSSNNTQIQQLPVLVQDVLLSDYGRKIELDIFRKYGFKNNFATWGDIISDIFFKAAKVEDLPPKISDVFGVDQEAAKKAAVDLIGMRLMPAKDYFQEENLPQIIADNGGDASRYDAYVKNFHKAIELERSGQEFIEENDDNKENETDPQTEEMNPKYNIDNEKEDSLKIFNEYLKEILIFGNHHDIDDYNFVLIELLNDNQTFKKDLENILYSNAQVFTETDFYSDRKKEIPTIGNWIQDFIKFFGSGFAGNLEITKYVTSSENCRRLSPGEKKNVQRLIQLYRNIKFFPDSLKDIPPERWEIIPRPSEGGASDKSKEKIGLPLTKGEKEVEEMRREAGGFAEGSIERLAIEEEIEKKKHIEDLKAERNKYKEGSLEWSALSTEINHLEAE